MVNAASPLVLINSTPQVNGVDVTASSLVTVALASNAGVSSWNLECIGTDELNLPSNITITIDHATNTATFTAPNYTGAAVLLRSTVNNGLDVNNAIVTGYQTTAKVSVLTGNSLRVGSDNETTEGSSNHGWLTIINPLIRNSSLQGPVVAGYVATTSATYTVQPTDYIVGANRSGAIQTINLPASPVTGRVVIVSDVQGIGASFNRTVSGNGHNINGSSSSVISTNYGSLRVFYNGSNWFSI